MVERADRRRQTGVVMAKSPHNSPLVRVAWTDAVSGNTRSTFKLDSPLELRLGLEFEPSFWTSFQSSGFHLFVQTFRFSSDPARFFQLTADTTELAGAPANELWVGMHFERAVQTQEQNLLVGATMGFRAHVWFSRSGGASDGLPQWASSPFMHEYLLNPFGVVPDPITDETVTLVGGRGTPAGTPAT